MARDADIAVTSGQYGMAHAPVKTVAQEISALQRRISTFEDTSCVDCRHPYRDHHGYTGRCWHPRLRALKPDEKPCRCKRFVDPVERLPL